MAGQRRYSWIEIDDKAYNEGLAEAYADLVLESEDQLVGVGFDVQNRARGYCPVDTGRLRSSISSVSGRDSLGFYVEVGTSVEYAVPVEFGHLTRQPGPQSRRRGGQRFVPAQPFMRPALAEAAAAA
jgi:hypothetical protein